MYYGQVVVGCIVLCVFSNFGSLCTNNTLHVMYCYSAGIAISGYELIILIANLYVYMHRDTVSDRQNIVLNIIYETRFSMFVFMASLSFQLSLSHHLSLSLQFPIHSTVDYDNDLEVYCYEGAQPFSPQGLANVWSSLHIRVKCENPDYIQLLFSNTSVDIIESENVLRYPNDGNVTFSHEVAPYNVFCVGVKYNGRDYVNYKLYGDVSLSWRFPVLLVTGAMLFFNARTMSRQVLCI